MDLKRSAWLVGSLLALGGGCRKSAEAPAPAPSSAAQETARPAAVPDAGAYAVEPQVLERFIRYQERALGVHAELLTALGRAERDGGDREAQSEAILRRHAQALDEARRAEGLSERDVTELEAIVGDVIAVRSAAPPAEASETVAQLQELAAKLPPDQRAGFDSTIDALERQYAEAGDLRQVRERYGTQNVDRVLAREPALTDQWNRAIKLFAGER